MKTDKILREMHENQLKEGETNNSKLFESSPQIGIFWILPDKSVAGWEYDPKMMPHEDIVNPPLGHHEKKYLNIIKRMVPEWKYKNWDHLSRGRIMFDRINQEFIVYVPSEYLKDESVKSEIISRFSLPKKTKFTTDSHYNKIEDPWSNWG
jgi:hypothetical protein